MIFLPPEAKGPKEKLIASHILWRLAGPLRGRLLNFSPAQPLTLAFARLSLKRLNNRLDLFHRAKLAVGMET